MLAGKGRVVPDAIAANLPASAGLLCEINRDHCLRLLLCWGGAPSSRRSPSSASFLRGRRSLPRVVVFVRAESRVVLPHERHVLVPLVVGDDLLVIAPPAERDAVGPAPVVNRVRAVDVLANGHD